MKRSHITTAATLMATSALAATSISEIDVKADLTALENTEAAKIWVALDEDLEAEIAEPLATRVGEEAASISVDIDAVSRANMFTQT